MKCKCLLCGNEFEIEAKEVQYLVKNEMVHPFVVCENCALVDIVDLDEETQIKVIETLGTEEGRNKIWTDLVETYPEIRTAHVINELDI